MGTSPGLNQITGLCTERNSTDEVVVALDILVDQSVQGTIARLHQAQRQRFILLKSAGYGSLRTAFLSQWDPPWGALHLAYAGKRNQIFRLQFLQKRPAFFVFELAIRAFPREEFAESLGKLRQAERRKSFRNPRD
jgi:hypothetical protein